MMMKLKKNYLKIILEFHKNNEYIDNTKNKY